MDQANDIIRRRAQTAVDSAAAINASDVIAVLRQGEQFPSETPTEEGAALGPAIELAKRTKAIKRRQGAPFPGLPRVRFEGLVGSIQSEPGNLSAAAFVGEQEKGGWQQEGRDPFSDKEGDSPGTPARPFFGLSDRALNDIRNNLQEQGELLVAELESVEFSPVTIQVNI